MIAATTIPRKRFSLRKHFRDIIIPHKITISTYLFSFLLGTILTFPNFLCHLKIGIIKESSVAPLSKVVIIQFQNADKNLNLWAFYQSKRALQPKSQDPLIELVFYCQKSRRVVNPTALWNMIEILNVYLVKQLRYCCPISQFINSSTPKIRITAF